MANHWYYHNGTEAVGPVTQEAFDQLVNNGTVKPTTLIWNELMANWQPYQEWQKGAPPPPTSGPIPGAGTSASMPGAAAFPLETEAFEYAGFWIRFVAKFVDWAIMAGISFGIGLAMGHGIDFNPATPANNMGTVDFSMISKMLTGNLISFGANLVFVTFFLGRYGATPGKMLCRIRVIRADGSPVSYGLAAGRYFGELLSGILCSIGYIIAAFDSEKKALHDMICNTRVVYKE
jgi:uncharacterized RDD family membrane protein YckC